MTTAAVISSQTKWEISMITAVIASARKTMPTIAYLWELSTIHFLSRSRKRIRWRATGAIRQIPAAVVSSRVT